MRTRRLELFSLTAILGLAACAGTPPAKDPELSADPPAGSEANLAKADVERELEQARGFIEAGKFDEARSHVAKALEKGPKSGSAHFYLGVLEEKAGKRDLAEQAYRAALQHDPNLGEAYVNLAAILLDDPAKPDEAIPLLQKALSLGVDDASVYQNLGFARAVKKDWEGSSKAYDRALAKAKGEPSVALAYGQVLLEAKDRDKAKAVLVAGYAKVGEDVAMLATYARFLGPARAFPECVKALDRALKLKPGEPEMLVRRGTCKHEVADEPGAQADFEAAAKADPKYAAAHYYLAMSLLSQKKRERGLKELELAAKVGEGTDIAVRAQAKHDELTKKKK